MQAVSRCKQYAGASSTQVHAVRRCTQLRKCPMLHRAGTMPRCTVRVAVFFFCGQPPTHVFCFPQLGAPSTLQSGGYVCVHFISRLPYVCGPWRCNGTERRLPRIWRLGPTVRRFVLQLQHLLPPIRRLLSRLRHSRNGAWSWRSAIACATRCKSFTLCIGRIGWRMSTRLSTSTSATPRSCFHSSCICMAQCRVCGLRAQCLSPACPGAQQPRISGRTSRRLAVSMQLTC